jgi:hypothetical protein
MKARGEFSDAEWRKIEKSKLNPKRRNRQKRENRGY